MPDDFADDLHALEPKRAAREKPSTQASIAATSALGMTMDEYLRMSALSASLLATLLDECPFAAWFGSWMNPSPPKRAPTDATDLGEIAHALLLEGNMNRVAVIDPELYPAKTTGAIPNGWTNAAIRAARDDARAQGFIPMLPPDVSTVYAMVDSGHAFIESLRESEPAVWRTFQPDGGASEQTFTWDDDGTLCKMRPDRISNDRRVIVNVKTTGRSPEPDAWARSQLSGMGYYRGAAFYRRGIEKLFKVKAAYLFLVISCEPPYLCSLVGCDPSWEMAGDSEIQLALRLWRRCVSADRWPKYPARVAYPEPPGYLLNRVESMEVHGLPYDIDKLFQRKEAA